MKHLYEKIVKNKNSEEYQRLQWETLRKNLNGLINKVNTNNLKQIVVDIFENNLLRGKGLFCRSIMKAQLISPQFTPIYTSLIGIINTKIPEIGELLCKRVITQLQKSFKYKKKLATLSLTTFIAHLVNNEILGNIVALELLHILIHNPTNDSIEIAKKFMILVGKKLSQDETRLFIMIQNKFKDILQTGDVDIKIQYLIEELFKEFKEKFKNHPPINPDLDIINEEDIVTHDHLNLKDEHNQEKNIDIFHFDQNWDINENEYKNIKNEILGLTESSNQNDDVDNENLNNENMTSETSNLRYDKKKNKINILDMTNTNTLNMRRQIYLITRSSLNFEEMAHKLLKMMPNEEEACSQMIIETCAHEKAYNKTFGLLGERLAKLYPEYQDSFDILFVKQYEICHRFNTNHIINIASFFAHLLFTDSIDWTVLEFMKINERDTNASKRIYIKVLFQELSSWMGPDLKKRLEYPIYEIAFKGLFPTDNPKDCRFSINFFTHIGLGGLTIRMRNGLKQFKKQIVQEKYLLSDNNSSSNEI